MGAFIKALGEQAAGGASSLIGAGLGIALAGWQDRRQLKQQQKLQNLQMQGQKSMIDYNQNKQMEFWKATGPVGQMEQYKLAGLNPGLMYGMGGGGGQSIGSQTANVTGATATGTSGEAIQGMGLMLQMRMQEAQIKLAESQAKKTEVEAEKIAGVDTDVAKMTFQSLKQNIQNAKAQEALTETQKDILKIEQSIKDNTFNDVINRIYWEGKQAAQTYEMLKRNNEIGDATKADVIKTVHAELVRIGLHSALLKEQATNVNMDTKLKDAMDLYYRAARQQGWDKLLFEGRNTTVNEGRLQLDQFVNDIQKSTGLSADVIRSVITAAAGAPVINHNYGQ